MQGETLNETHERRPVFLLRLSRVDITSLLAQKRVSCTIPGTLDGKAIALDLYGAQCAQKEWFEAQLFGKSPFSMFVPGSTEAAVRRYLGKERFEIRTSYLGTRPSAYAKFEIEPE